MKRDIEKLTDIDVALASAIAYLSKERNAKLSIGIHSVTSPLIDILEHAREQIQELKQQPSDD